ncbi:DUF5954 family protein [Actinocorallia sp. A-T 12471]|uniref:DUF5954 family protein n=1 Tax=Actinocorallia sp. A-T 12471 TaxID=3089813 RepID=UPI0029D1DDFC|nr:DUF5954 family protein [Actinocorallia sp. A-T 12471]MDX6743173.1 DUF5954 family protein [Actinocorallia sp. A-T 12471]
MAFEDEAAEQGLRELMSGDPVRALAAADAARARTVYPVLVPAGPMFGVAERVAAGWRVRSMGEATPQCARDDLATQLRQEAQRAPDPEPYQAAARRLDWQRHDELTVAGRPFRVIRVEQLLRMNATAPEGPRPTDPDPKFRRPRPRPLELLTPDGPHTPDRVALATEFADLAARPGLFEGDALADAQRALDTHPIPVPMAAAFSVAEFLNDGWRSATAACTTPHLAREALAEYLQQVIPAVERPDAATRRAYEEAAALLTSARLDEIAVAGRRFRVVRLEKIARFGQTGPEMPRTSDFDPDPPIEIMAMRLRADGIIE